MAKAQNNAWSLVIIQQMIPKQRNFKQKLKFRDKPWTMDTSWPTKISCH